MKNRKALTRLVSGMVISLIITLNTVGQTINPPLPVVPTQPVVPVQPVAPPQPVPSPIKPIGPEPEPIPAPTPPIVPPRPVPIIPLR